MRERSGGWNMAPSRGEQMAGMAGSALAGFSLGSLACVLVARRAR